MAKRPVSSGKKPEAAHVEFVVDLAKDAPVVTVGDVGPSPRAAAVKLAQHMKLRPRDYQLLELGARLLIRVDAGDWVFLNINNAKVRLKSPDGNLAVVTTPLQTSLDESVLLILSRLALKTNWVAMVQLAGSNIDERVEKTLRDNPRSEQFLVRVGSTGTDRLIIRPLGPWVTALLKQKKT
jgi:hypothetical protein